MRFLNNIFYEKLISFVTKKVSNEDDKDFRYLFKKNKYHLILTDFFGLLILFFMIYLLTNSFSLFNFEVFLYSFILGIVLFFFIVKEHSYRVYMLPNEIKVISLFTNYSIGYHEIKRVEFFGNKIRIYSSLYQYKDIGTELDEYYLFLNQLNSHTSEFIIELT